VSPAGAMSEAAKPAEIHALEQAAFQALVPVMNAAANFAAQTGPQGQNPNQNPNQPPNQNPAHDGQPGQNPSPGPSPGGSPGANPVLDNQPPIDPKPTTVPLTPTPGGPQPPAASPAQTPVPTNTLPVTTPQTQPQTQTQTHVTPTGSVTDVVKTEASGAQLESFNIFNLVSIANAGSATGFVFGSAVLVSATYTGGLPSTFTNAPFLSSLLTVDAAGTVSYDLGKFNFLSAGHWLSYTIAFDVQSGTDTLHLTLTFTVNGTNQAPTITVGAGDAASATIIDEVHATILAAGGTLSFKDADSADGHSVSVAVKSGPALGSFAAGVLADTTGSDSSVSGFASWIFVANKAHAQSLAVGESETEVFTVTLHDGQGGSASQDVAVTVAGVNDAPVVTSADPHIQLTETTTTGSPATQSFSSSLTFTDPDLSDVGYTVSFLGVSATGVIAGLPDAATLLTLLHPTGVTKAAGSSQGVINATFSASEQTFDYLWAGETVTLTYTLQVADSHGGTGTQTVTVTATGTNDAPVINQGPVVASVQEDTGTGSVSGQFTATDVDGSATKTWTALHGSNYQFKIDEFKIEKNGGVIFDDTFSDGNPPPSVPSGSGNIPNYLVTGTISEQNGKAVLTGANAAFGAGSPAGDPFFGEYATLNTNIDPTNTTLGLKDNSSFIVSGVFDLTLPPGNRNEYGIRLTDRTSFQAGDDVVEVRVTRGTDGIVKVQLVEHDFAAGTHTVRQSFNLNPGSHDKILLTLTHDVIDGKAVHASFQLGTTVGEVVNFDAATNFNPLVAPTIFNGENWTRAQFFAEAPALSGTVLQGTYGQLEIAQDGTWTYQLANGQANVQALAEGQTEKENFAVQVADGQGGFDVETITINVSGTNDLPVAAADVASISEDATPVNGNLFTNDTDVDTRDTHTITALSGATDNGTTLTKVGTYGTLVVTKATGAYTYTLANGQANVQALQFGQQVFDGFTYTNSDNHGGSSSATLTVSIFGANDAPVAVADTAAVTEDSESNPVSGNVLSNDTDDTDDTHTVSAVTGGADNGTTITKIGTYGTLVITKATGAYTYTLANGQANVQALAADQQVTDVFTYTNSDNHGGSSQSTLTVTVTGVNDVPVAMADVNAVTEDSESNPVSGNVLSNDTDVDSTDSHTVSALSGGTDNGTTFSKVGTYGTLVITKATGAYTYTLANGQANVQALADGQQVTDVFTYTNSDNHGGSSSSTLTVTVAGADDSPTAEPVEVSVDTASDTNVMIILDVSGSMGGNAGLTDHPDYSRLEAAIAAIDDLLDQYDSLGDVKVQIVKFSSGASQVGTDWMSVADAKAAIAVLTASGNTNYDDALTEAMSIFTHSGKLSGSGVQNVSYFLSDGEPSSQHDVGFAQQTEWETFLTSNDIVSFALGISDGSPGQENLAPIAFDPASGTQTADTPIIVTDLDQLTDTLVSTTSSASGSLISGANSFGGDGGGYVKSITVDGVTYTFDPTADAGAGSITTSGGAGSFTYNASTKTLTVDTDTGASGGELAVVMTTGAFTFQPTSGFTSESVGFTLTDGDGDTASSTLQLTSTIGPAGIAGSPINLGLHDPAGHVGPVTVTIAGIPAGWTVSGGTDNGYGVWTVQADNVATLSITSPQDYAGAMAFKVTMSWSNADHSVGHASVTDNVEAFPQGAPIFAWAGDDHLTGSAAADLFVFARPIGLDTIYSFDASQDRIDLIGYAGFSSFNDVQRHLSEDSHGNAVLALAAAQSITLMGVAAAALTAGNFVFDQTPVLNNLATMTISDGALLPLSGVIDNAGTIALDAAARDTHLQLIQNGVTLKGGGQLVLSDSAHNFISGSLPGVTLTNLDNTISGAGQLGAGQMGLVNDGTIVATGIHALVIDTGANVVTNDGTLAATGSGGLIVNSDLANSGLIWAHGGSITISGAVTGSGSAMISGAGTLEFGAASSADVTFAADAAGRLTLEHPAYFTGTISGFSSDDQIDLANINYATASLYNVTYNASTDTTTLVITDGTSANTLQFVGNYTVHTAWHVSSDSNGGTLLTDSPVDGTSSVAASASAEPTVTATNPDQFIFQDDGESGTPPGASTLVASNEDATNGATTTADTSGDDQSTATADGSAATDPTGNLATNLPTGDATGNGTQAGAPAASAAATGLAASDTFVFAANFGNVTVTNFDPGTDAIEIDHTVFADFQQLLAAAHDDGNGNAVIAADPNDTITLKNVTVAQLVQHQGDFHFT
jgi:VCBS repeat-containing protein